jgi:predicted RNA methylase
VNGCCSSYGAVVGTHFDEKIARRELTNYRQKGPGRTTRLLRDLLVATGRIDGVLLDIGSGIGGLTFELLERGIGRAVAVDASVANIAAASEEAARRGVGGIVQLLPRRWTSGSTGNSGDTGSGGLLLSLIQAPPRGIPATHGTVLCHLLPARCLVRARCNHV